MVERARIAMLIGPDESSRIMYHALKHDVDIALVIMESPVSKRIMLKKRLKRLGFWRVFGQVLFFIFNKIMVIFSRKRIEEIKRLHEMCDAPIDAEKVVNVRSINDKEVVEKLSTLHVDAIVVNGTRIISAETLADIDIPFLNTHVGITPKYRGVHGGYWALAENDPDHCGVTVHMVDAGIDTGGVVSQERIDVTDRDDFNTYPYLQMALAIPMMRDALQSVVSHRLVPHKVNLSSKIWYHPTLWEYIYYFITKRVR